MSELWWGLYFGLVVNLAVGAALNNTFFEPTTATWLITLGTANEVLGLLMVASPELIPRAVLLWRLVRKHASWGLRQVGVYVRLLLGIRRGRVVAETGTVSTGATVGIEANGIVGPPENATPEELIQYLLRQDRRHQEDITALK